MFKNAHFEELGRIGDKYSEMRRAHDDKRKGLIEAKGWDSPEVEEWYTKKQQMQDDFNTLFPRGIWKAYRAWRWGKTDELVMDDFLWEGEVQDFVDTLRRAGLETFVYTNSSTACMENLHGFAAAGCTLMELCTITMKENRYGEDEEVQVHGVRFKVN